MNDEIEKKITKPAYLGAFILSYSRRIMFRYMNIADPDRFLNAKKSLDNSPWYTDTGCGDYSKSVSVFSLSFVVIPQL